MIPTQGRAAIRAAVRSRLLAVAVLTAGLALPARAQIRGSGDGYLFHEPMIRASVHAGYARAAAGSDLFDELTTTFILSRSDFSAITLGGEVGYQWLPRVELSAGVDYAGARAASEYRFFEDTDDQPIEQTMRFERVPIMANVRLSLRSRGRRIGRLAWVPTRVVPWIGAGAGPTWYRFRQTGDFVDARTNAISYDELRSDGWTLGAQAMAGLDVAVTPAIAVTAAVRSTWARAELGRAYSGYERLDLSGVAATLGITFRP
jgi:opacity protein-like surface antigen